ncbi:MAG TPA: glycosyltransferase family 39 protein [Bryobacteraceae bacterium]|nr:glycosyltransferase family 39 protein [Bryobacteraceae bacterium]
MSAHEQRGSALLWILLFAVVGRLWLMPLPSSFWVDETATAFIARYGAAHPSVSASPEFAQSIYYPVAHAVDSIAGFSEVAYRLPSVLLLGAALALTALIAARLTDADSAWLAAFACLAIGGFNFQAADARPYALGTAVMAAAMWFLIRWLDNNRWRDAVGFVIFAALLWPVHPVYWPFYAVFAAYACARLAWRETPASWMRAGAVFAVLGAVLVPEALRVLALRQDALKHVIAAPPRWRDLFYSLIPALILACLAGSWLLRILRRATPDAPRMTRSSLLLIVLWWCWTPVCLFAFSHLTRVSLFVPRYYSLALPGAAMLAATLVTRCLPRRLWRPAAAVIGIAALALSGQWTRIWPEHTHQDWRGAAHTLNQLAPDSATPIIFPSPFIEGRWPTWHPGYRLPSVLYAPAAVYPLRGKVWPFPRDLSTAAEQFAAETTRATLAPSGRFYVYAHSNDAQVWDRWFRSRPELAGWSMQQRGDFGDVVIEEFAPNSSAPQKISGSR